MAKDNKWRKLVKKLQRKHPDKPLPEILQMASEQYDSGKKGFWS